MAVTVPQLQRIEPSAALPANDRIKMQAPEGAADIINNTNAIAGVADKGLDIYQEFENSKITQLGQEAEQKYSAWNAEQLATLKGYKGDPTDAYAQYEKTAKDKYDELLNERPDLNERVRGGLQAHLDKTVGNQRIAVLKQRGAQQETYANNLFESQVKLKKTELGTSASFIQKNDPGSFLPMDENIAEIKTTIAKRAIDQGTATRLPDDAKSGWNHIYKDTDGNMVKVAMTDIAKQKAAKELSQGIGDSINSMVAGGYTEEAQAAMERYDSYLDPKTKAGLETKFKTTAVKASAYKDWGAIQGKPEAEQMKYISAVSAKYPEIGQKLLAIKNTNDSTRFAMKDRSEKTNDEYVLKAIMARQASDSPLMGTADLENLPEYDGAFNKMSVKGLKTAKALVDAPKESDPKALIKMQNLKFGHEPKQLQDLDPIEFAEYKNGLSKADQRRADHDYEKAKMPSNAEVNGTYRVGGAELQRQLLIDGTIVKDKYNKISGDDEITLLKAQDALDEHIRARGKMSPNDIRVFVKEHAAEIVKGKVIPSAKAVVNPPTSTKVSTPPPASNNVNIASLSPTDKSKLKIEFKAVNNYFPVDADPKFQNFIKNKK